MACIRRQEKENRQKITLVKNHLLLREKLDVDAILPHLDANELLTVDDRDLLMNITWIQSEKINYLIRVLPKKSYGWFDKFLDCLDKSTCGTGHVDIKQALSITYDILITSNLIYNSCMYISIIQNMHSYVYLWLYG